MAKWGLFGGNLPDPMQTFEGDSIAQKDEYVYVWVTENKGGKTHQVQVAAVKLGPGQVVKKIG